MSETPAAPPTPNPTPGIALPAPAVGERVRLTHDFKADPHPSSLSRTVYIGGEPYAIQGFRGTHLKPRGDLHLVTTQRSPAYPFTCKASDFEVVARADSESEDVALHRQPETKPITHFTLPSGEPAPGLHPTTLHRTPDLALIELRSDFPLAQITTHQLQLILNRSNGPAIDIHANLGLLRLWSTQSVTPNLHLLTFLR